MSNRSLVAEMDMVDNMSISLQQNESISQQNESISRIQNHEMKFKIVKVNHNKKFVCLFL